MFSAGITHRFSEELQAQFRQMQEISDMHPDSEGSSSPEDLIESELRDFIGSIAGMSLYRALPAFTTLIAELTEAGARDEKTAVTLPDGTLAWSPDIGKGITAFTTSGDAGNWITYISKNKEGLPQLYAAPWIHPESTEINPLLPEAVENGDTDGILEILRPEGEGCFHDMETLQTINERMLTYGHAGRFTMAGSMSVHEYSRKDEDKTTMAIGHAFEPWSAYVQAIQPIVRNILGPYPYPNYRSFIASDVMEADNGFPGNMFRAVVSDLEAARNGYAMLQAARGMFNACKGLEEAGCLPGKMIIFNDLDERVFTAWSPDGQSLLIGYENISFMERPREFAITAHWNGKPDGDILPYRVSVYPVYRNLKTDVTEIMGYGRDAETIAELSLLFGTGDNPRAEVPRLCMPELVRRFTAGEALPAAMGMLDTASDKVTLNALSNNCVSRGAGGVSAALRALRHRRSDNKEERADAKINDDERFTQTVISGTHP